MKIEDGTGKGYFANVDDEFRLSTFAVTEPEEKHVNREGKVWSVLSTSTPVGAADYVFYHAVAHLS